MEISITTTKTVKKRVRFPLYLGWVNEYSEGLLTITPDTKRGQYQVVNRRTDSRLVSANSGILDAKYKVSVEVFLVSEAMVREYLTHGTFGSTNKYMRVSKNSAADWLETFNIRITGEYCHGL